MHQGLALWADAAEIAVEIIERHIISHIQIGATRHTALNTIKMSRWARLFAGLPLVPEKVDEIWPKD